MGLGGAAGDKVKSEPGVEVINSQPAASARPIDLSAAAAAQHAQQAAQASQALALKEKEQQPMYVFHCILSVSYLNYITHINYIISGTSIDQAEREHYSYGSFWLHCWTTRETQTSSPGRVGASNSNF